MAGQDILLDLYACAREPGRWPRLLDRLCEDTGACSAVVQAFAFEGDGARLHWQALDTRTARRHAAFHALVPDRQNPRLEPRRGLRGLNRVVRDDELFDAEDPALGALQSQLAMLGLGRFMGTLQPLSGNLYLGVALHRSIEDRRDFSAAAASRLAWLAPHVGQACEIAGSLRATSAELRLLNAHLDTLRCALLVCGPDGRVRWHNQRARELVGGACELQLREGRLHARGATATAALTCEIAAAAEAASAQPRFLALGRGGGTLHLALRGMRFDNADASVLLAVSRAHEVADVPAAAWSRLLGVTLAEAQLVTTLVRGGTLEQHATLRSVSIGTVRGQLKQVLSKTQTGRQAELVSLALSSAAAHVLSTLPATVH